MQHVVRIRLPFCDMLGVVGSSLKLVKFEPTERPTCRNMWQFRVTKRMQHVAPNNAMIGCIKRS